MKCPTKTRASCWIYLFWVSDAHSHLGKGILLLRAKSLSLAKLPQNSIIVFGDVAVLWKKSARIGVFLVEMRVNFQCLRPCQSNSWGSYLCFHLRQGELKARVWIGRPSENTRWCRWCPWGKSLLFKNTTTTTGTRGSCTNFGTGMFSRMELRTPTWPKSHTNLSPQWNSDDFWTKPVLNTFWEHVNTMYTQVAP